MNVNVENLEHNMAKLTVTVPADVFEAATVKAYNKNKGKFSIPGFRKGKTPKAMIEKIYGEGIFYEDAVDIVLNDTYADAAKESGLDITSRPEIDIVTLEKGKDFVYSALVAVKPEVTLGQYKGVEVEKAAVSVKEGEVEKRLDEAREQNARIVTVEDADREIRNGDIVTIDFEGFIDGKPFDGGKGEDYPLTIGSHSFIDTFEDQLIGHKSGDDAEVNVKFPGDYQSQSLAGADALFKVKIKEIKEKIVPEADDDFASEVSEFETLSEYKASILKNLEEEKEKAAAQINENRVVKAVTDNAEADIPEAMILGVADGMVEDYKNRLEQQGIPYDQFLKITGQTGQQILDQAKETAKEKIMTNLVLEAVAKAENIDASEEDVDAQIAKMAEEYKIEAARIREMMGAERLDDIKADLRCQKVIDFLVSEAVLKEPEEKKEEQPEQND